MRLIDADKLLEEFNNLEGSNDDLNWMLNTVIPDVINKQPTAYDIDKVLEELEKEYATEYGRQEQIWNRAIERAIEIVKDGGNK